MPEFFGYMRNITYYLLFAALAGMAAPSGKYQKYIRLVTGFILVVLLLQPLQSLLQGGVPVTELFAKLVPVPSASETGNADFTASYEAWRYETIQTAFEEQLQTQLASLLTQNGYTLHEASFDYTADFSQIERVTAEVSTKAATPASKPFIYIEPVKVSILNGNAAAGEQDETVQAIKKLIGDFYNVSPDNIYVRIAVQ